MRSDSPGPSAGSLSRSPSGRARNQPDYADLSQQYGALSGAPPSDYYSSASSSSSSRRPGISTRNPSHQIEMVPLTSRPVAASTPASGPGATDPDLHRKRINIALTKALKATRESIAYLEPELKDAEKSTDDILDSYWSYSH
eukprot:jgi/Hompol1/2666/HPOL_005955-RA